SHGVTARSRRLSNTSQNAQWQPEAGPFSPGIPRRTACGATTAMRITKAAFGAHSQSSFWMCTNTHTSWITALTGSRTSKHSGRTSTGRQQTTYSSVHQPYGYSILTCCCGKVPSLQMMKSRRTDGSTRGNLQVDTRLGRDHLDRTPLFLQLGKWTA